MFRDSASLVYGPVSRQTFATGREVLYFLVGDGAIHMIRSGFAA